MFGRLASFLANAGPSNSEVSQLGLECIEKRPPISKVLATLIRIQQNSMQKQMYSFNYQS